MENVGCASSRKRKKNRTHWIRRKGTRMKLAGSRGLNLCDEDQEDILFVCHGVEAPAGSQQSQCSHDDNCVDKLSDGYNLESSTAIGRPASCPPYMNVRIKDPLKADHSSQSGDDQLEDPVESSTSGLCCAHGLIANIMVPSISDQSVSKRRKKPQLRPKKRQRIGVHKKYHWTQKSISEAGASRSAAMQENQGEMSIDKEELLTEQQFPKLQKVGTTSSVQVQTFGFGSASSPEDVCVLANNMALLLSEEWTISCKGNLIRIYVLRNGPPVVLRSVTWCQDTGQIVIQIHSKRLPEKNIAWAVSRPDLSNLGSVSDYLCKVCRHIEREQVCPGVVKFESCWRSALDDGVIETDFHDVQCFRADSCSLLVISGKTCRNCQRQSSKFMRAVLRSSTSDPKKDFSKVNLRFLSRDELENKAKQLQKEKRYERIKTKRLKNKIQRLLKQQTVCISKDLHSDLHDVLEQQYVGMTDRQRLFWDEQKMAHERRKNPRSMRWSPFMVRFALHLQSTSNAAYDIIRSCGFIRLPSRRRLYDFSHFMEAKEGIQVEILNDLKEKIDKSCSKDCDKYFNILQDEMHIRSNLVFSSKSREMVGYTNLDEVTHELRDLEAEMCGTKFQPTLAKKVVVFMLTGITTDVKCVIAIYSTDDLTAARLYDLSWMVIYSLENIGIRILTYICDGAAINRKFVNMHTSAVESKFVFCTVNWAAADELRHLFFILDPPHIFKTIRNCFANSYAHKRSRYLWNNGEHITWKAMEALYQISLREKFKSHKLTQAHIKLTSFSAMNVALAVQAMSGSVVSELRSKANDPLLQDINTKVMSDAFEIINRAFDCFNCSSQSKKQTSDLLPYTCFNDERFSFLKVKFLGFFDNWKKNVTNRQGMYTKEMRSKMIISHQSLGAINVSVNSFIMAIKFLLGKGALEVNGRKFNQDALEQYFSTVRMKGGASNNPDLLQTLQTRVSLHVQDKVAEPLSKGNTELTKRLLDDVDNSPLPVLKKKKYN